jgi:hypothetical protein
MKIPVEVAKVASDLLRNAKEVTIRIGGDKPQVYQFVAPKPKPKVIEDWSV